MIKTSARKNIVKRLTENEERLINKIRDDPDHQEPLETPEVVPTNCFVCKMKIRALVIYPIKNNDVYYCHKLKCKVKTLKHKGKDWKSIITYLLPNEILEARKIMEGVK